MEIELRPYQLFAKEALRDGIRTGFNSQLLIAPTGSGKTVSMADLLKDAWKKGSKSMMVVDRINLLGQSSAVLDSYDIPHGIIQAGSWRYRPNEPIQIASAQTLEKRGFPAGLKLLIVDEAHCKRKIVTDFIKANPQVRVAGCTATPFAPGLGEIYPNFVNVTTTNKLIEEGWLIPLQMYAAKEPDMTGAQVVAGEWSDKEVERRGIPLIGDIKAEWRAKTTEHFGGPVKTILFAPTVDYGAILCASFQADGFNFQQVSYKDGDEDDQAAKIAEFRKRDSSIIGLVACEMLTKGFDVPDVRCGIAARPYRKSLSSHVQQLGRVMRPADKKAAPGEYALWLDHAGNLLRFWDDTQKLFEHGVDRLNTKLDEKPRAEPTPEEKAALKCAKCGFVLPPRVSSCPSCGHARQQQAVEVVPGTMVLVGTTMKLAVGKHAYLADPAAIWKQLAWMALHRYPDKYKAQSWAAGKFRSLYGRKTDWLVESVEPAAPCDELVSKVKADTIRYIKGLAKAEAHA